MNQRPIILASSSPRRREILERMGVTFIVDPSEYKEDMTLDMDPAQLAKYLSLGKARDVLSRHSSGVLIAADTFVVLNGKVMGKPHTAACAQGMLRAMSGNTQSVITGFTLVDIDGGSVVNDVEESLVHFKELSQADIDDYVATGEPFGAAGSYRMQGEGRKLVVDFEGNMDNIIGLPSAAIRRALESFGVTVPGAEK